MTTIDAPRPRHRAFWGDMRFFVGIVLVVGSVAGVWATVAAARVTQPVLAAARTIVPGQPVTADDLRVVEAALAGAAGAYVTPDALAAGAVATRTIEAGELVPAGALAPVERTRLTTVVVTSATGVPSEVKAGSVVEVWAAPVEERGGFSTPSILVADATIRGVTASESMIGAATASLELVIPRSEVAAVLESVAAGSALSVVPSVVPPVVQP